MRFDKSSLLLYAVGGKGKDKDFDILGRIESAIAGGVTLIQLREKSMSDYDFLMEAKEALKICHRGGVPLIINDRLHIAVAARADGIHVGIEDTSVSVIRKKMPSDFIIGATAKTVDQARAAEEAGADYLGVGAVFPSPTKTDAIRITKDQLSEICSSVSIPAVAIGGITHKNADELKDSGIAGIAVSSAVFSADDIETASRLLKEKAEDIIHG